MHQVAGSLHQKGSEQQRQQQRDEAAAPETLKECPRLYAVGDGRFDLVRSRHA